MLKLEDKQAIWHVVDNIIFSKRTKESYVDVLEVIKKDKDAKNYLIDLVVGRVFGEGKLGTLMKISAKIYLFSKFGI